MVHLLRVFSNSRKILIVFFLLFICVGAVSCSDTGNKVKATSEFTDIIDSALQMQEQSFQRSEQFLDSAYRAIQPTSVPDKFAYYSFIFNRNMREYKKYNIASLYADSMLLLFDNGMASKYPWEFTMANYSKGDALFGQRDYTEAYKYYYKAKVLAGELNDTCVLNDNNYRLAMVLYKQGRYDESAKYFKAALGNGSNCRNAFELFYRQQEIMDNIGLCYYHMGNIDSAINYYNKTLAYINDSREKFPGIKDRLFEQARAVVYGNLAVAQQAKGNNTEAEDLLKKSIAINSQPGYDPYDAQGNLLRLAQSYIHSGKMAEAEKILEGSRNNVKKLNNENLSLEWNNIMWQYYSKANNLDKAYVYLLAYNNLKDSVVKNNKKINEVDINERFKILEKQYEINDLARKNERNREYMILMMTGAVMSFAIGFLIIRNWRKSRQNVKELAKLNSRVQEQYSRLEQTLAALEESNKEKDRILSAVSHDIRNPILAVTSLAELLLMDKEDHSQEYIEYITLIQEACSHALTLSNDLLEVSKNKQMEHLEKEPTDITALLRNCVALLRFRAINKGQQLTLNTSADKVILPANKEKLMRVVNNIITNAIKFTPENAAITIDISQNGKEVTISVQDEGIGIPGNYKDKVFDMFTEAKRPGTAGEKPFGLGLSISRQIVDAHGGRIWFTSNQGEGTTFFITLPLN